MAERRAQRRLSTIRTADVVGDSRLTDADEEAPPQNTGPTTIRRNVFPCFLIGLLGFGVWLSVSFLWAGRSIAPNLLRDPDDFMQMLQVLDWMDGQSWYDTVQKRLNPPEGVLMHWSRLSDLPLAWAVAALEPFVGRGSAVDLAVLMVPALLGGTFGAVFVWAAVPLSKGSPLLVAVLMMGALALPFQYFRPGRVDHHALQLVLAILSCGCLIRAIILESTGWALWIGIVGGVSLALGMEALPLLGAVTIALSLVWVARSGGEASLLLAFGAALVLTALVLFPVTQPPSRWLVFTCDQLSVVHIALAGIVPLAGAAAIAFARAKWVSNWVSRLIIVGGTGCLGVAAVLLTFPQCATGPFGELSEEIMYWVRSVAEALPLAAFAQQRPGPAISYVVLPVAALVYTVWQLPRAEEPSRSVCLALCVLVVTGLVLTMWQNRGAGFAGTVAALALIPLAAAMNERADRIDGLLPRLAVRLCVPVLAIVSVMGINRAFDIKTSHLVAKKVARCDVVQAAVTLNDPKGLGALPMTLAAPVFAGPKLLFLTRHRVLAAPYHRNVQGLADNRRIFSGREGEALETIERRGVDAIFFCPFYANYSRYADRAPFLSSRLMAGKPPRWLAPVAVGDGFGLYLVKGSKK